MRKLQLVLAMALAVAMFGVNANAAERVAQHDGQVPAATLADLGLGGMELVSDQQGEQIRGKFILFNHYRLVHIIRHVIRAKHIVHRRHVVPVVRQPKYHVYKILHILRKFHYGHLNNGFAR